MWEPTLLKRRKAAPKCRDGLALKSRRGQRAGHVRSGVPQEPGRSCRLRKNPKTRGERVKKTPGLRRWRSAVDGSEDWNAQRYRQAKATKCGGTDGRESERSTVPMKPGNRPAGTRWREGDAGLRNV